MYKRQVIYRMSVLKQIGVMDEKHFAYLEDLDLGYRARIAGYRNRYIPEAKVYQDVYKRQVYTRDIYFRD